MSRLHLTGWKAVGDELPPGIYTVQRQRDPPCIGHAVLRQKSEAHLAYVAGGREASGSSPAMCFPNLETPEDTARDTMRFISRLMHQQRADDLPCKSVVSVTALGADLLDHQEFRRLVGAGSDFSNHFEERSNPLVDNIVGLSDQEFDILLYN